MVEDVANGPCVEPRSSGVLRQSVLAATFVTQGNNLECAEVTDRCG
jgi:hypothetical protein